MSGPVNLRREIHRNPERSGCETGTAERLLRFFEPLRPDEVIENLGDTGIAFVFTGIEAGPTILLRSELDALPIQETNEFKHRSVHDGTSHKCGHDGHMAILAAVGEKLSRKRPARGRVVLLYQPAEETGQGAAAVVADEKFAPIKPDFCFALHNLPGFPLGEIVIRNGTFSCASRGQAIRLTGKTAHAAQPETGVSPAKAMCQLIAELSELPSVMDFGNELAFATVVGSRLGEQAFGTAPGEAEIWVTLRSETDATMARMVSHAESRIRQLAVEHGLESAIAYRDIFAATVNSERAVDVIRRAADDGLLRVAEQPFRWSEDFGCFSSIAQCAMFGLGAGEAVADLHNPDYDFPDALISLGADIFLGILEQAGEMQRP
ncbi:N-acetyldiaminopimelate deacetylase [bacterium MnTg04]|nr:N-acetyldiaminopimelate deacetylase [bacterium MnTg04]